MKIFRGKKEQKLSELITDENFNEPLVLLDENDIEYIFEKVWCETYNDAIYCVLRDKSNCSDYYENLFICCVLKDLYLRFESDKRICRRVITDFYKGIDMRGYKFLNLTYKEQPQIRKIATDESRTYFEATEIENSQTQEVPKFKKTTLITLIISYSLLLLAGILLAAVPQMQSVISGMGICDEISARAYAITIGLMWIALTPSIGYYFATIPHFEISKKSRGIIAVITTLILVTLTVVFFIIVNTVETDGLIIKYYYAIESDNDVWFLPVNMVFGVLGIMVCYALTLFKLNPDGIKDINSEQKSDGLFHVLTHAFMLLIGAVLKLVKVILKLKENHVNIFIVLATILLTWLIFFTAFIFAIICIAVLVGAIIMYFAGVIHWAYTPSEYSSNYLEIYDGGIKLTLERQPYAGEDRYEEVYRDNYGRIWYSKDGGKTVYKKE